MTRAALTDHVLNHGSAWADLLWLQCQQEKEIMTSLINKDQDQMLCCSVLWSSDLFQVEEQEWPEQWLVCGLEQCPVPPYSQFLNPVVEFFSSWRRKAFSRSLSSWERDSSLSNRDWSTSVQHSHHFPQENIVWWGWNSLARHKWDAWWICKFTEIK